MLDSEYSVLKSDIIKMFDCKIKLFLYQAWFETSLLDDHDMKNFRMQITPSREPMGFMLSIDYIKNILAFSISVVFVFSPMREIRLNLA